MDRLHRRGGFEKFNKLLELSKFAVAHLANIIILTSSQSRLRRSAFCEIQTKVLSKDIGDISPRTLVTPTTATTLSSVAVASSFGAFAPTSAWLHTPLPLVQI